MVRPTYDDDQEDSSDEEVDEAPLGGNGGSHEGFDLDEFDNALNQMSITPKDSLKHRFGGVMKEPLRMPSRIRPSTSPESL